MRYREDLESHLIKELVQRKEERQKRKLIAQNKKTDGLKVVSISAKEPEHISAEDIDFGDL